MNQHLVFEHDSSRTKKRKSSCGLARERVLISRKVAHALAVCIFIMLEVAIIKHNAMKWEWRVCNRKGRVLMHGWEPTRPAAKYKGDRALFLLLAAGGAFD